MRSTHIFEHLQHSTAMRLGALCLVILAASPWTAPFSTFDNATITLALQLHDGSPSDKASQDLSAAVHPAPSVEWSLSDRQLRPLIDGSQTTSRVLRATVLRI